MTSLGRAGGSLRDDSGFALNAGTARAGRDGEVATAAILDKLAAAGGFTVLHDLFVPGVKANIDHVVVAGASVWVIDSKKWKPGFYFTVLGRTYRGFEPVPHADKRGIPLVHRRLAEHLAQRGVGMKMQRPVMVIHPSRRGGRTRVWAYRPASDPDIKVRAITPGQLRFPSRAADPRIVAALARLVN